MPWPETPIEPITEFIKVTLKVLLLNAMVSSEYKRLGIRYEDINPFKDIISRRTIFRVDYLFIMEKIGFFRDIISRISI